MAKKRVWGGLILIAATAIVVVMLSVLGFFVLMLWIADIPLEDSIGVIPIKGEIVSESSDSVWGYQAGARQTVELIRAADEDPDVAVILLDINSGGGSVVASKEIARAVWQADKPVVAYIGDVGASGAYYVASAADEIVADEASLTASIGVVAMIPNYMGLMEKLGVNMTIMSEGKYKVMGNPYEEFTEEEQELFQGILHEAYTSFRGDVLTYRTGRITEEQFDAVADGRIMSGKQALEAGLIDFTGSRELAIERAKVLGGIEGDPYPGPWSGVLGRAGYSFGSGFLSAVREDRVELIA